MSENTPLRLDDDTNSGNSDAFEPLQVSNQPEKSRTEKSSAHKKRHEPFARAANEDDDGYDPWSDRPVEDPFWEKDPWS